MTDGLRIRRAVRALLIDPDDRILLVRFEFPTATVWALPGGGVDPGETDEIALRRELREECGLVDVEIGPVVWRRLHVVPFLDGSHDGQQDHVHLVRSDAFDPRPEIGWERLRAERVHELRWWTSDELRALTTADERPRTAPSRLPELALDVVRHGPPDEPPDVDP